MEVDHIGYAVKDIEKSKAIFETIGYSFGELVEDHERNVYICFGTMDSTRIELVSPLKKDASSPVDLVLSKNGPTSYHICYKSSSFEDDIEQLKMKRFRVTVPPAPAVAFSNKRVVFLYSLSVGLIELVEA